MAVAIATAVEVEPKFFYCSVDNVAFALHMVYDKIMIMIIIKSRNGIIKA